LTRLDTDSVVGDTNIIVDGVSITIEDYYDSIIDNYVYKDDFNENYIKESGRETSLSFNIKTQKLENNTIKYVMKHKVKKEMFVIEVDGKIVVVTEDHSVVVRRCDEYISVSPRFIKKDDDLINI